MAKKVKKAPKNAIAKIRKAMKAVQASGGKIKNRDWGARYSETKGCFTDYGHDGKRAPVCALGALLVYENGDLKYKPHQGQKKLNPKDTDNMAAYVLGVDDSWVGSFIDGFDHNGFSGVLKLRKKQKTKGCCVDINVDHDGNVTLVTENMDTFDVSERKLKTSELTEESIELLRAYKMGCQLRDEFGL